MTDVLAVGIAVQDQVYSVDAIPSAPAKHFARAYEEIGGGPAANAAVTIARLGGKAALWARLGADAAGDRILAELEGEGVDVTGVRRFDGCKSGVSSVLVDRKGERMIVAFADASLPTDTAWLPLDRVGGTGAVLADIRWPEAALAALIAARKVGCPGILDADRGPQPIDPALLEAASHLVFSEDGLAQTTGIRDPEAGLRTMADRVGGFVAVTGGGEGAFWLDGGRVRKVPAPRVEVVDTVGAGDVFHGAFALALARGREEAEALAFANAAAALKCTRAGGRRGIPTALELDRFRQELAA